MIKIPRVVNNLFKSLAVLAILAVAPSLGFAQDLSTAIPANAHANRYGDGWQCDSGFHEVDKA